MVVRAVKTFGIVFDDESKSSYSSGDRLSGQVLLDVNEEMKVKGLRAEARGSARVNWCESPSAASASTRSYREEVVYVHQQQSLWQTPAADGEECFVTLQPGKHEFPFSFQLPQEPLVTSFNGKYGNVQYWVTAIVDQPRIPSLCVKREFNVTGQIDVNTPALLSPISKNKEKTVSCWFFTSGPISVNAKIERRGFCNGEAIPIYAEFENCSSRLIVPKAAIYQTQTYLANEKTKTFKQMIGNVRGNHIASGCTDSWNGKALKIPPVTPSILDCSVIRVEYSLAVYIHIPGAKRLMLELPLVIGTVPYNSFGSRTSSICREFSMDMTWLQLALPEHPEAPPNYADIVSEEELARPIPYFTQPDNLECEFGGPIFAYIQEFRFQPPPLYSEIDPYPTNTDEMEREVTFEI